MTWEYAIDTHESQLPLTNELNMRGCQGWELVAVAEETLQGFLDKKVMRYYWKRLVTSEGQRNA